MILVITVEDFFDEAVGLGAAQVTRLAAGVVVVLFLRFIEDEIVDIVVPHIGVFAIFLGKSLCVIHMSKTGVVGSQHEFHPFGAVGHLVFQALAKVFDEFSASFELLLWGSVVSDLVLFHDDRHKLHEAESAFLTLKVKSEMRLLVDERGQQAPVPANVFRSFLNDPVETRELAFLGLAGAEHIAFVDIFGKDAVEVALLESVDPSVECHEER